MYIGFVQCLSVAVTHTRGVTDLYQATLYDFVEYHINNISIKICIQINRMYISRQN